MRSVVSPQEDTMLRKCRRLFAVALIVSGAGCLLDSPDTPELAGPSMRGRALELRAIPDSIVSDGFSSSVIEAVLRGPNSERIGGATIDFELRSGGVFLDLGNLAPLNGPRPVAGGVESGPVSAVTDGDGVARARYWAPFRTDQENDTLVTILAREQGTNFRFAEQYMAETDIFLRAANRPSFPGTNECSFIIEPQDLAYRVNEPIFVTATQDIGANGHPIARYEWDFGDRASRSTGRNSGYVYTREGTYTITLFTTESVSGNQESCTKDVEVTTSGAAPPPPPPPPPPCPNPTATFVATPLCSGGEILSGSPILFDGTASTSGGGALVSYVWSFGDGTGASETDPLTTKTYAAGSVGLISITLQVTNDCGNNAADTQSFDLVTVCPP
jgi:hypothetical protein